MEKVNPIGGLGTYTQKLQPEKNNQNLPTQVMPGINDHKAVLFTGNNKDEYTPETKSEALSMNMYKNSLPSIVQVQILNRTGALTGYGSGSIIDKNGHVLTNHHVAGTAPKLKVLLSNGKEVEAKRVGTDPDTDLAVLKLDMPKEEAAKLNPIPQKQASKNVQGGQNVFAVGSPFGFENTMTKGIVSATNREIKSPNEKITAGVIQTDATINPGNSGGALLNSKGEQIGVNAQIYSPSGASHGIGFAIPMETANKVAKDLINNGRVIRPYIGIEGGDPTNTLNPIGKKGLAENVNGVVIKQIDKESPAEKAGLKRNDIITKVNDKPVKNMAEISSLLNEQKIGDKLSIEYIPNNSTRYTPSYENSAPQKADITVAKSPKKEETATKEAK